MRALIESLLILEASMRALIESLLILEARIALLLIAFHKGRTLAQRAEKILLLLLFKKTVIQVRVIKTLHCFDHAATQLTLSTRIGDAEA